MGVCQGTYAPQLRAAWEKWDKENNSENIPVSIFPAEQNYVVFAVADGGADLEHFKVFNMLEVKSILLQVMEGGGGVGEVGPC